MMLDGLIPATAPKCACPVLTSLLQAFQSSNGDDGAKAFAAHVAKLPSTKTTADDERARAVSSVEFSVRTFLPRALATAPGLDHLATEVSSLPALSDETHNSYVQVVGSLAVAIRTHVMNDPLAQGGSAMKAIYQVQYLLEQYRTCSNDLAAQIMASAFSRIDGDSSAVQLMDLLLAEV